MPISAWWCKQNLVLVDEALQLDLSSPLDGDGLWGMGSFNGAHKLADNRLLVCRCQDAFAQLLKSRGEMRRPEVA